ncbi:MAG TPA: phosphatase PAP2 family protein [Candidatus Paceibacterota bacterium]
MNEAIFYFFYNFSHQSELLDRLFVFFADTFPYIVIFLAFVFLLKHHDVLKSENPFKAFLVKWKEILGVFICSISAWILARMLKIFINTDRPFTVFSNVQELLVDNSFSFPSGHATFFGALAVLIFFHHKKTGLIFMFFALLISAARIMAGVHFPIDILGGFALGALIAYFVRNV